jgi:2-methylisocitrate lyase-like PEP mutase family enzyme
MQNSSPQTTADTSSVYEKFRELHKTGCFLIPNPWDIGSAQWLAGRGFAALATTSAGLAWSKGLSDQGVSLELMLAYIVETVRAVPGVPVNADFENGYAESDAELDTNIQRCLETGVAGLSIEDATGDPAQPQYDFQTALKRVQVARKAVDKSGVPALLTARAEAFLYQHPDALNEVCLRFRAFADAGADVLYAPGISKPDQISAVVKAAQGKPVNFVAMGDIGLTMAELEALGVRRVSVGSALAKAAWTGFNQAVEGLQQGHFKGFAPNMPSSALNGFFR